MRNHPNHVAELAAKAGDGHPGARLQLRKQMATQMVFIVRRTLQTGNEATSLDRRILAEARRLDASRHDASLRDPEQRIRAIADALCNTVLENLRPAPIDARPAEETIVDYSPAQR